MAAVASRPHSPIPSSHTTKSSSSVTEKSSIASLSTSQGARRSPHQRPPSYARSRISSYSIASRISEGRSRPPSYAFPAFHSSLPYALVRDFAYPIAHPCHYGPPPLPSEGPSGTSTPVSERNRRLSDPIGGAWDNPAPWDDEGSFADQQLPQIAYGDGPPYSEDDDLHSPIVQSSRHKKIRGGYADGQRRQRARAASGSLREDISEGLEMGRSDRRSQGHTSDAERGSTYGSAGKIAPSLVTYPPDQTRAMVPPQNHLRRRSGQRDSQFPPHSHDRSFRGESQDDSEAESVGMPEFDDSRYSKDYQFTIASPDEEMHGKAVALFDFARENENELPLTEGQVIWVSYRHGQGWLVAQDPKTGDAGLVPEEYVRLLRDIEGGWSSLSGTGAADDSGEISPEADTEAHATSPDRPEQTRTQSASSTHGHATEKNPAVVSSFSTSSKDLNPYPHPKLGGQAGYAPPQVTHYGSPVSTPTLRSPAAGNASGLRNFEEIKGSKAESHTPEM